MILVTKTSDQTRQSMYVCMYVCKYLCECVGRGGYDPHTQGACTILTKEYQVLVVVLVGTVLRTSY